MRHAAPVLFLLALGLAGVVLAAGESPAPSAATATTEALSPILRSDGWCVATSTTAANAWSSAPGRITPAIQQRVRVIEVQDADASIAVCAKLGPTSSSDGLTCALDSGTSGYLRAGEALRFALARDMTDGTVPPIWLRAASGTPTACVNIAW